MLLSLELNNTQHIVSIESDSIKTQIQLGSGLQCSNSVSSETKGQLISKCLFVDFNFFQKTNKNTSQSDDHVTVFSLLGDVIHQQAENKQILVLRPF